MSKILSKIFVCNCLIISSESKISKIFWLFTVEWPTTIFDEAGRPPQLKV